MLSPQQVREDVAAQLNISTDELTDHDDLLLIGLDSIRLMVLVDGWRKAGASITYADVAAEPTVASILDRLGLDQVNP